MKKQTIIGTIITCLVVVIIITVLFYPQAPAQSLAIDTYATEESVSTLSNYMNDFCFDLYHQLSVDNTENLFISPYSIFVALAMTYEGARSDTAEEMETVLHFSQNNETMLCSFGKIYNLLNQHKEYTLNTANALWKQNGYPFLSQYVNFIENYYMGKATDVDFSNADKVAQQINQWVEEHTNGKIKDLLTSSDIHPLTKMILTNAIYFNGDWLYKFNRDHTTELDFETSHGNTVKVPMMSLAEAELNYAETDDIQILELPYKDEELSMLIVLPKENDLAAVEQMIDRETLVSWQESFSQTTVDVSLPKFTMETEYRLKEYLIDLGMQIPFTMDADFSGMNGNQDLFIEKVLHKAYIEVNEEGTEAAGTTSVHMVLKGGPEGVVFNADHPFILLILQKETGLILFIGKMCNPSA
jgi:serpin B